MKGMIIEDGTCGHMCPKPTPFRPIWVEANWVGGSIICQGSSVGQKTHFAHMWVGLTCKDMSKENK